MTSGGVGTKNPIDEDRRIQSVTHSGSRIQENREDNRLCTDDGARSQPVRGHVSVRKALRNYERLPEFDGMFYFEDFLDWIYDLDDCLEYMRLSEEKKYLWAVNKVMREAKVWWYALQRRRLRHGKNPICSWPRMMKLLMDRYLPRNYLQILEDKYRPTWDAEQIVEIEAENPRSIPKINEKVQEKSEAVELVEVVHEEIHENLTHGVHGDDMSEEFEEPANCEMLPTLALGVLDNNFSVCTSGIQTVKEITHVDVTFDGHLDDFSTTKEQPDNISTKLNVIEATWTNGGSTYFEAQPNQKGLRKVSKSDTTFNLQSYDFIGVENFSLFFNPCLVDIVNKLKSEEKRLPILQVIKKLKQQIYSKYLFFWDGRFQHEYVNSRTSFFQVKENDVGHVLVFYYFRRVFILIRKFIIF